MKIVDLLARRRELSGDKLALVSDDHELTFAQLDDRASRAASLLEKSGVTAGDRVAVLARNGVEIIELLFAVARLDALLVPLNWRLSAAELAEILDDCEPLLLLFDGAFADVAAVLEADHGYRAALRLGPADDRLAGAGDYEGALAAADGGPRRMARRDDQEPWYLLYTSGTTGRPKGVIQTFGMCIANMINIGQPTELSESDTTLNPLPMFHTGGLNLYTLPTLLTGATALVPRAFDPQRALEDLHHRATMFFGVPAIYQLLAEAPGFDDADLSRVRSWACGGAPMPVPLLERYAARGIRVRQGMGMTETGPTVFLLDEEQAVSKAGSVGRPQLLTEVRIVDRDGRDVPDGEAGELLIRGPNVTPGYWNRPDETAAAIEPDGWLHSGDVARRDEDGDYYIVDRWKDMYISGGENVYPAEVEQVLFRHPAVAEVAVIGVPDEKWGEVGQAVVIPRAGESLDAEELRAWARERLAAYKVPRHVRVVEDLPRNATGKILKHELRAEVAGGAGTGPS